MITFIDVELIMEPVSVPVETNKRLFFTSGDSGGMSVIIPSLLSEPDHLADSDGSMFASGSAGPGFNPRRGSEFSTSGLGGVEMYTF